MAIEFVCPSCGHVLKLQDKAAGKRGRCPHCKSVITVPETTLSQDDLIEIIPIEPPKPAQPPKPLPVARPASAQATTDEPAPTEPIVQPEPVKPPELPEPPVSEEKNCPGCGKPIADGAVICINCGLNLKTGQKLQTVFEEPEPEPEPEPEEPEKQEKPPSENTPEG